MFSRSRDRCPRLPPGDDHHCVQGPALLPSIVRSPHNIAPFSNGLSAVLNSFSLLLNAENITPMKLVKILIY